MRCLNCGRVDSLTVIDSRPVSDAFGLGVSAIRRRRKCIKCGNRFTTHEVYSSVIDWMIESEVSGAFNALAAIREILDRLGAKLGKEEIQSLHSEADRQRRDVVAQSRNRFLR